MTALCGWVSTHDTPAAAESKCQCMLKAQSVYGSEPARVRSTRGASFGLTLFSVLPEDAFDSQPLQREDILLIADARIDNRIDLAAALGLAQADAQKLADSDLILRAWNRWGEACLLQLIGDFAIAAFYPSQGRLFLARDPTGQRPLFYAQMADRIAFSSMPSGLLAVDGAAHGFDTSQLARALLDVPNAGPSTYFLGVKRVLPGEVVAFHRGQLSSRRYWEPQVRRSSSRSSDYTGEYRALLNAAVHARTRRAHGNLAAQLSSGLDSNSVASTAAMLEARRPIYALTAAPRKDFAAPLPRGKFGDESALAAATAKRHGLEHVVVRSSAFVLEHIASEVQSHQEPRRNIVNGAWIAALNRTAHRLGATVLLSGELGNLTLNAGSASVLADFIQTGHWLRWCKEARAAIVQGGMTPQGVLFNSFGWLLPRSASELIRRVYRHEGGRSDQAFLREEWRGVAERHAAETFAAQTGNSYRDRINILATLDFGTDRKGSLAAAGVDIRDPLSDRRLIDFSLMVPPEQLFHRGMARSLARTALGDRVPHAILKETERGYQSADWYELMKPRQVRELVEEISFSHMNQQMIDFDKLNRAIDHWPMDDYYRPDVVSRYVGYLPLTLAIGMFIQHHERRIAASH